MGINSMKNKEIHIKFIYYVIPSLIAFALSGVYAIVDGYFIGNRIGDAGLAAINLAFPLTAFVQSLGTGIGMGGAIRYSIFKAKHDHHQKNQFFTASIAILATASFLSTAILLSFAEPILLMFGASEALLPLAKEYSIYILMGATFQIFGTGLIPFIRNMGNASFAMIAMLFGFITNVSFDYLFIWVYPFGLKGAAIASVMGQAVTVVICLIAIFRNKERERVYLQKFNMSQIRRILSVGLSPFGLTFIPNVTLLLINKVAITLGGDQAVATYAVISYVVYVVYLLLQGISDGCQPLASHFYGKQDEYHAHYVRRLSFIYSLLLATIGVIGLLVFKSSIGVIFGASEAISNQVSQILPLFTIGCFFVAVSRCTISYFYACTVNKYAYICIYGEVISMVVLLFVLPYTLNLGLMGVWYATPLTQFIIMIIGLILLKYGSLTKDLFHKQDIYHPTNQ